jgi:hypothetical protein
VHVGEELLAEVRLAVDLPDGPDLDPGASQVDDDQRR